MAYHIQELTSWAITMRNQLGVKNISLNTQILCTIELCFTVQKLYKSLLLMTFV